MTDKNAQQALEALKRIRRHRNHTSPEELIDEAMKTLAALESASPSAAGPKREREALYRAAINCPHEIDSNKVVLHFDSKQPGHNALNQLARRLDAAAAGATPATSATSADPAPTGVPVGFVPTVKLTSAPTVMDEKGERETIASEARTLIAEFENVQQWMADVWVSDACQLTHSKKREQLRLATSRLISLMQSVATLPAVQPEAETSAEKGEAEILAVIDERDRREEVINVILDEVLGPDRHEWSSAYDFSDAIEDVKARMYAIEQEHSGLESQIEDLQSVAWPDWANQVLKIVRSASGYDGHDDSDGVDIPGEVQELADEYSTTFAAMETYRKERDEARAALKADAPVAEPVAPEYDVRKILIGIVPGMDGMGHEVYAESVTDVEELLTKLSVQVEDLRATRPPAPEEGKDAAPGKNWMHFLESIVDIYFDGIENDYESRTYVEGSFAKIMKEARAVLKQGAALSQGGGACP